MQIYEACLAAANQLQNNPDTYNIMATDIPTNCGTPGCVLGWIGHFLNITTDRRRGMIRCGVIDEYATVAAYMKIPASPPRSKFFFYEGEDYNDTDARAVTFYKRMTELCGSKAWTQDAELCAHVLRAYAAKYHAPEIPDWNSIAMSGEDEIPAVTQDDINRAETFRLQIEEFLAATKPK